MLLRELWDWHIHAFHLVPDLKQLMRYHLHIGSNYYSTDISKKFHFYFLSYPSHYSDRLDKGKDHLVLCLYVRVLHSHIHYYREKHLGNDWHIATENNRSFLLFIRWTFFTIIMRSLTLQTQNHRIIEVRRHLLKSSSQHPIWSKVSQNKLLRTSLILIIKWYWIIKKLW